MHLTRKLKHTCILPTTKTSRWLTLPGLPTQEPIDGDLASRVFSLLQVVDSGVHAQRVGQTSRQRLDIAILGFFQNFRKVYVGEQVMHCSKVRLSPQASPLAAHSP